MEVEYSGKQRLSYFVPQSDLEDPKTVFENARSEMIFVRTLILHMDTTFMEKIL